MSAIAGGNGEWHTRKAHARVGLVGNPSDGFYGKTIAVAIANFWAEVSIKASEEIVFEPHPVSDPHEFDSLDHLHEVFTRQGYQGAVVLLQATCKKFCEYCRKQQIDLGGKGQFTLRYDTNIPRQVGLAGSSAFVTATLHCLLDFFGLGEEAMPLPVRPSFVLGVEVEELGIQAGLQDRVIQTYEGVMYMDFAREHMDSHGYGQYQRLDTGSLPPLWLAYDRDPSNSGKIHSDVKARFMRGDPEVLEAMQAAARAAHVLCSSSALAMHAGDCRGDPTPRLPDPMQPPGLKRSAVEQLCRHPIGRRRLVATDDLHSTFATYTDVARDALSVKDWEALGRVMKSNFELRRRIYGDACLGEANLKMISIASELGVPAKFSGSGGAIVGMCTQEDKLDALERTYAKEGFCFVRLRAHDP